jgi:hypothetical protein
MMIDIDFHRRWIRQHRFDKSLRRCKKHYRRLCPNECFIPRGNDAWTYSLGGERIVFTSRPKQKGALRVHLESALTEF